MPHIKWFIRQCQALFKIDVYKKRLFYVGLILTLLFNMVSMQQEGYPVSLLFFKNTFSLSKYSSEISPFFKSYIYHLTDLMIGEPSSLLAYAIPGLNSPISPSSEYDDVVGYFNQDEASHLAETNQEENIIKGPPNEVTPINVEDFKDPQYVMDHYLVGGSELELDVDMLEEFQFDELIQQPIRLDETKEGPQVLIFHTHSREEYIGDLTVIDVAKAFKKELEEKYGISVLHITDSFYEESNLGNRPTNGEYERMEIAIEKVLEENPSISVVIDMHRDGVNDNVHLLTDVDGKPTAKVMFVAPLCRHRNVAGEVVKKANLPNPYIADNLAFALQMQLMANEYYPELLRKIYCREWRFSTHMAPQSLLVEWGAQTNTDEEALNAVEPMARILAKVLQKD